MSHEILAKIQRDLSVPKSERNEFGGFNYRSAEQILDALKPMLDGLTLRVHSEPIMVGDWHYIQTRVTLCNGDVIIAESTVSAREVESRPKMDAAQISGAAFSYSLKYALCGLFSISPGQDPDAYSHQNGQLQGSAAPPSRDATVSAPPDPIEAAKAAQGEMREYFGGEKQEDVKIPAPTPAERQQLIALQEYYKGLEYPEGMKFNGTKMCQVIFTRLNRYPQHVNDAMLVKQYVDASDVMVPVD